MSRPKSGGKVKKAPEQKPDRFVRVVGADGEPVKRLRRGDLITAIVIDRNNKVLHALDWDVAAIDRAMTKAQKRGASEVALARELMSVGDEVGTLVSQEVGARLVQRDKERK